MGGGAEQKRKSARVGRKKSLQKGKNGPELGQDNQRKIEKRGKYRDMDKKAKSQGPKET